MELESSEDGKSHRTTPGLPRSTSGAVGTGGRQGAALRGIPNRDRDDRLARDKRNRDESNDSRVAKRKRRHNRTPKAEKKPRRTGQARAKGGSTKQTGYPKQQSIPFYTQTRLMFIKKYKSL
jgi:hypothetical protein